MEIPRCGHDRQNYVKNVLSEELGDRIFGVDPALEDEITVDVHLNDILPTVEYDKKEIAGSHGRSKAYEDKDIPLRVTVFPLSSDCLEASENMKDLIILIKLALYDSVQEENDGEVSNKLYHIEKLLCHSGGIVHSFKGKLNSTFLVLINSSYERCFNEEKTVSFLVSNQRRAVNSKYNMRPLNRTLNISIIIRCVDHENSLTQNPHLMRFLYLE